MYVSNIHKEVVFFLMFFFKIFDIIFRGKKKENVSNIDKSVLWVKLHVLSSLSPKIMFSAFYRVSKSRTVYKIYHDMIN